MMLIDADAINKKIADIRRTARNYLQNDVAACCDEIESFVDEQPTIEAEPVRHSKWVAVGKPYRVHDVMLQNYKCRDCKESMATRPGNLTNYCPSCGSKMDGGADK